MAQTTPIIARVDKGMDDLDALAQMTAGDPVKTEFAKETLSYISVNLMQGQQEELARRITGEAGADGLIVAASKAVKARSGNFWTKLTSDQVREVFNYYQSAEARLLLLRVEYMHANPHKYSGSYIEGQIRKVETELRNQNALLKPSPPAFALVDTRTNLVWYLGFLDAQMTAKEATDFVDASKASGRELPNPYAIQKLIEGWHGANWAVWLDQQIGGQLGALKPFYGVWTSNEYACFPVGNPIRPTGTICSRYAVNSDGKIQVRDERDKLGVLRVKARTENYWW